ncbi:hypothetical protein HUJ04_009310 [Dendroctonus ponderosae]|nr:hypothetical protein HUJ04_009310 [Dendroctonus ponderosae]
MIKTRASRMAKDCQSGLADQFACLFLADPEIQICKENRQTHFIHVNMFTQSIPRQPEEKEVGLPGTFAMHLTFPISESIGFVSWKSALLQPMGFLVLNFGDIAKVSCAYGLAQLQQSEIFLGATFSVMVFSTD